VASRENGKGMEIRDGKVDGASLSFVTKMETKRGDATVRWEAKVDGDTISGTRVVEGRKRSAAFTWKRAQ
jgi:hypothetical protein